ncbi:Lrp/AsnC family transcriptional regulator [Sphingobacterium sp.]|uniref:Lrp/AsnC family transcriptional regulator n=1 Tax=Sphingobacterium sp. TaxID=341027 RepID=UPI00289FF1A1|nr:Lrp/AsnC family transcriptional regulator [Sphingobacterium sp.]
MDKFDIAILNILQENNLTPQRDIGDIVGLSAAAVQRRIKRMRLDGVIRSDASVLNIQNFGNPITLLVEVYLESERIELIDETKKLFIETPEVQQCFYITGESDFFLIIVIPSMHDYEQLTRRIFFGCKNVKSFRTIVVLSNDKQSLKIPLSFC